MCKEDESYAVGRKAVSKIRRRFLFPQMKTILRHQPVLLRVEWCLLPHPLPHSLRKAPHLPVQGLLPDTTRKLDVSMFPYTSQRSHKPVDTPHYGHFSIRVSLSEWNELLTSDHGYCFPLLRIPSDPYPHPCTNAKTHVVCTWLWTIDARRSQSRDYSVAKPIIVTWLRLRLNSSCTAVEFARHVAD